jgi:LmbE family N-acetylglucosaminyl deacetylase
VIGATSEVWDFRDGRLEPTLDVRWRIITELRQFAPDLVLTHRTSDYHPDHRAVGQAVQDASYLVTVPAVVPEVPHLRRDPVVAYMPDHFTRPQPFEPDVAIDVEPVLGEVVLMLACHRSQVFDWLPYNRDIADQLPPDEPGRLAWLAEWFRPRVAEQADRFRQALIECYGDERGAKVHLAEGFEISEYAGAWNDETRERLFGFLF